MIFSFGGMMMDIQVKDRFISLWRKYFNNAELPITFYYTSEPGHAPLAKPDTLPRCIVAALSKVRKGTSICIDVDAVGCAGGKKWMGFTKDIRPNFEYFLSCGIPGKMEGERYKKSPELVKEVLGKMPVFSAPAPFMVFKRWDKLGQGDTPDVFIFYARPDVLSGLFTLASFDVAEPSGVFSPFGSGCSSIVMYPYLEKASAEPRCVIGMFDPSARPFVPDDALTFAAPINKLLRMVDIMEESFLTTGSWQKIQKRIK
jgi:hypothetical protein